MASTQRMDMASGKIHWRKALPGTRGSSALVGDTLLALCETGDLIAARISDKGYTEIGRMKILEKRCWSPFAIADGKLIARNNNGDPKLEILQSIYQRCRQLIWLNPFCGTGVTLM